MNEEWRDIKNYTGYQVSNFGRIRSYRPLNGIGPLVKEPRILKFGIKHPGYHYVNLATGKKPADTISVHKLVLEAFVGPKPDGMECDHFDGDHSNNSLTNLRWVSPSDNQKNRIRCGQQYGGKLTPQQAIAIYTATGSNERIAASFGVSTKTVRSIRSGKSWKAVTSKSGACV